MARDVSELPYRQGANAFIVDETESYLLIVQKQSYADNQWDVPGGGKENGETPQQTVIRELEEELGLKNVAVIQKSPLINRYEWPLEIIEDYYKNRGLLYRGQEKHQFLIKLDMSTPLVVEKSGLRDVKWVGFSDLREYLVFDGQCESALAVLKSFGLDV